MQKYIMASIVPNVHQTRPTLRLCGPTTELAMVIEAVAGLVEGSRTG
jgi:hypothetical protein